MNMLREMKYTAKINLREFGFLFWTLAYPLMMATFFYLAFQSMLSPTSQMHYEVGISKNNPIRFVMQEVPIFSIKEMEYDEAMEAMKEDKIIGYIQDDGELFVQKNGLGESILAHVITRFRQLEYSYLEGGNLKLNWEKEYLDVRSQTSSPYTIYFYALIAMVSFYGVFSAMECIEKTQANISSMGKRMASSPQKKLMTILSNLLMILILNYLANLALILYITFALKISLFIDYGKSLALLFMGNFWGISLGILIGVQRMSTKKKEALAVAIPLFSAALGGMMTTDLKLFVMKKLPLLDKLNPVSIVSSGFYKVNLLQNQAIWDSVAILVGMSLLFLLFSVQSLRRKHYDSL